MEGRTMGYGEGGERKGEGRQYEGVYVGLFRIP